MAYSVTFNYLSALRAVTKCNSSKHQPNTDIIISGCFSESSRRHNLKYVVI